MEFIYTCIDCGREKPKNASRGMICGYCGGELRGQAPYISTTDTFSKKKAFVDERTGKEIGTWKQWEKAGYTDPLETKNHTLKEKLKEGIAKRKHRGDRKLENSSLPL